MKTMQAGFVEQFGKPLVQTEACGVCHIDLHAAHGDWPVRPTLPFIPGHEGDRVGVPWLYSACGHCEYCLAGRETVCPEAQFGGYTRNGGVAEHLRADPDYLAHVPASPSAIDAAPLICAGLTSYKGIKETGAKPERAVIDFIRTEAKAPKHLAAVDLVSAL